MIPDLHSARLDLRPMTPPVLRSLLDRDLSTTARLLGAGIASGFDVDRYALKLRLRQLEHDPDLQPWLMRAIVLRKRQLVIGDIGFHTAPGAAYLQELAPGGIEFGISLVEEWRSQGLATEASHSLMHWARHQHGVSRFVLSISPDNTPSLKLAARLGFHKIGSHLDEIDGPEDVFERTFDAAHSAP
jgi:RimJ/RimL family protein N-acetyltransferase